MIEDVTESLMTSISSDLNEAIEAITVLSRHFDRETLSAAIGELSERLVAKYAGAERMRRSSRGHDLKLPGGTLIEVKSRFLANYGDDLQFNFRSHTKSAHEAYWVAKPGDRPQLDLAYRISIPFLVESWGAPRQKDYCARTTLGKLRAVVALARA